MRNKLIIDLVQKEKDGILFSTFYVVLNNNGLQLFLNKQIPRTEIIQCFLSMRELSHFVFVNYIGCDVEDSDKLLENHDLHKTRSTIYMRVKKGLNYYDSLIKSIARDMNSKNTISIQLREDMKDTNVENIFSLFDVDDTGYSNPRILLDLENYFDYSLLKNDYPEYLI